MDEKSEKDFRDPATVRLDLLIDQINRLTEGLDKAVNFEPHSHNYTVTHSSEGMGAWGTAAVTACFFTFLGLILFAVWVIPNVHDLMAWRDIHQNHISALEAKDKAK